MSYSILDESLLELTPDILGYYIRYGFTAASPVLIGLIGFTVFMAIIHYFF